MVKGGGQLDEHANMKSLAGRRAQLVGGVSIRVSVGATGDVRDVSCLASCMGRDFRR